MREVGIAAAIAAGSILLVATTVMAGEAGLDPRFLDLDDQARFDIIPGDNSLPSCEEDCVPEFDYHEPDLWYCEVVSPEDYATGNYPGGTICRKISE